MRVSESQPPYAVVRRLLLGDPNRPEVWFRVVTWAPSSGDRELIGFVRTLDLAAQLAWDYHCAFNEWRHHLAARRASVEDMRAQQPSPSELVKFWREHKSRPQRPDSRPALTCHMTSHPIEWTCH
ncbi:hypothetical protein [Leifsonia aquatica]